MGRMFCMAWNSFSGTQAWLLYLDFDSWFLLDDFKTDLMMLLYLEAVSGATICFSQEWLWETTVDCLPKTDFLTQFLLYVLHTGFDDALLAADLPICYSLLIFSFAVFHLINLFIQN